MKNNDDIPTTDTTEIKQLINRVKRPALRSGAEGEGAEAVGWAAGAVIGIYDCRIQRGSRASLRSSAAINWAFFAARSASALARSASAFFSASWRSFSA